MQKFVFRFQGAVSKLCAWRDLMVSITFSQSLAMMDIYLFFCRKMDT